MLDLAALRQHNLRQGADLLELLVLAAAVQAGRWPVELLSLLVIVVAVEEGVVLAPQLLQLLDRRSVKPLLLLQSFP